MKHRHVERMNSTTRHVMVLAPASLAIREWLHRWVAASVRLRRWYWWAFDETAAGDATNQYYDAVSRCNCRKPPYGV